MFDTERRESIWRVHALIFAAFGLISVSVSELIGPEEWYVLGIVCGISLFYSLLILRRMLLINVVSLISDPLLILVASFSLYFLGGPLLLVIGPEDQANYALQWYPTNAMKAVHVTGMNFIGMAIILFSAGLYSGKRIEELVRPAIGFFSRIPIANIFWLFFVVGLGAKLLVLNVDFANTGNAMVSGATRALGSLTYLAVLIGVLYRGPAGSLLNIIGICLGFFDSIAGLLLYNKLAALIPVAILLLGFILRHPSLRVIAASAIILLGTFAAIQHPTSEARIFLEKSEDKSLAVRADVLWDSFMIKDSSVNFGGACPWSRLCYIVPQAAATELYDSGNGGDDLKLLGWVFLPRLLFPDKPIMTLSGSEFNERVTGTDSSATGVGLFLSAYYNEGWMGLVAISLVAGWIFSVFGAISRVVTASGSLILLPINMLGGFTAFRIDGHFIGDLLGPFAMTVLPFLFLAYGLRMGGAMTARDSSK